MDIRCKTCSKLFRIADEKIAGKGIRFKCSQCGDVVTILREDLENDRRAREAATAPPQPAIPLAPPPPPQQPPAAVPSPKLETEEQESRTHQPPVPSGLDDFDFSMPHEAAVRADQHAGQGEADAFADLKPAQEEGGGPEISISEEEEKAAEEAFQFPVDIISEPKRKSPFESVEEEDASGLPAADSAAGRVGTPEAGTARPIGQEPFQQEARAAGQREDEEIDLGAALAIPAGAGAAAEERPAPSAPAMRGTDIHPFASGNATGAAAGIGCSIPVIMLLVLGIGMLVKFMPVFSSLPIMHLAAAAGAGIVGMGILVGLVIAVIQALAGRKLLFLVNILLGTLLGAGVGLGIQTILSFALGKGVDTAGLIAGATAWLAISFLISIVVVIARRLMVHGKEATFEEPLSGLQKAGLAISALVVLASLYADGSLTGRMEKIQQDTAQKLQQLRQLMTPEGLTVVNASGHIDPANGDLVVSGTVQNTLDRNKQGWYLVVDVYDGNQKVITQMKMVNGAQAFSRRDIEILVKRGAKVDELVKRLIRSATQLEGGAIPAKGSVQFELRLPEPSANAAGFLPVLRSFDPIVTLNELTADLKR